jgi:hypothetical protein
MANIKFRVSYNNGVQGVTEAFDGDKAGAVARALNVSQMTDSHGNIIKAYVVRSEESSDTGHTAYRAGAVVAAEGIAE